MIATTALIYGYLLTAAMVAVLVWVYRRTHAPAALAYAAYTVLSRISFWPQKTYVQSIASGEAEYWLGATEGERIANYVMLNSAFNQTIQTALLLWLVVSLVNWSRGRQQEALRSESAPQPAWPASKTGPETI